MRTRFEILPFVCFCDLRLFANRLFVCQGKNQNELIDESFGSFLIMPVTNAPISVLHYDCVSFLTGIIKSEQKISSSGPFLFLSRCTWTGYETWDMRKFGYKCLYWKMLRFPSQRKLRLDQVPMLTTWLPKKYSSSVHFATQNHRNFSSKLRFACKKTFTFTRAYTSMRTNLFINHLNIDTSFSQFSQRQGMGTWKKNLTSCFCLVLACVQ